MLKYINFEVVKSIIIASPGFVKDEFFAFLKSELEQNKYPELKNRQELFILEHVTSGFKHSLKELLTSKSVQDRVAQSSAVSEAKILEDFNEMLRRNPDQAAYGKAWVEAAVEQGAVKVLLISDKILKAKNIVERKRYIGMTKSVKNDGGTVIFFSSMHATGEALNDLTGIAAILRYSFPDPNEDDDEEEVKSEPEEEEKSDSEETNEITQMFAGLSVEASLEEEKEPREEIKEKKKRKKSKSAPEIGEETKEVSKDNESGEDSEEKEEEEEVKPNEKQKVRKEMKLKEKADKKKQRKTEQQRTSKREKTLKTKQERNTKRDLKG
eukprot:TRINITY_DN9247_c0_g2_i1.p1 TRINITY_DN9247_c0_g2~~TRINITY_DN9247_c0_g2_i1.p1  ORF type:complete len:325 (-),score=140.69 TRINITY_DN9247_c0_g2_i1:73-1047(-)